MSYGRRSYNQTLPSDLNYKRPDMLKEYLDDEYKILPRRQTRLRSEEQRKLTQAIKRARFLGLLPYTPDQ